MPIRAIITDGTTADCTQAIDLIIDTPASQLIADRGYEANSILDYCQESTIKPVIPPKRNRKIQREYCKSTYKKRHCVENAFLHLKRWRGVATRYAKNKDSFLAAVHICSLFLHLSRDYTI